jgi:hypothetical protein
MIAFTVSALLTYIILLSIALFIRESKCRYCEKIIPLKEKNNHLCEQMAKKIQKIQSDRDFVVHNKNAFRTTFEFICVNCGRQSEYKLICATNPQIVRKTTYIRCQDHTNKN